MPFYRYQATDETNVCLHCGDGFEIRQGVSDPALDACPWCGAPVGRVPSAMAIGFSQSGLDDRAKSLGFSKLERIGKGEYERKF